MIIRIAPDRQAVSTSIGPSLDDAFRASRQVGMSDEQFQGVVRRWIDIAQLPMPRNLVKGKDADWVYFPKGEALKLIGKMGLPHDILAMHFHDTFQTAIANVDESLKFGIARYDSSASGIGGCPYAPGASGNVSTNTLVENL